MSINEKLKTRLNSCVSVSSQSFKNKIKIPPAFVPDEWVCNHKHKRHTHEESKAVKHVYVRPNAVKRNSFTQAKDKTKLKGILSPIPASINLRATPLEIKKITLAKDETQLEKDETQLKQDLFIENKLANEDKIKRFEKFNGILRGIKESHIKKRTFSKSIKKFQLKRLKKSFFHHNRKKIKFSKNKLKSKSLVNLSGQNYNSKEILIVAKKYKGKKVKN